MKKLDLENDSIFYLIMRFSIPSIIGCFVTSLYNLVDRYYIGKLNYTNSDALTGVGLINPVATIILAFSVLVGIGASSNISIKLGEKDERTAEKLLGNSFLLIVVFSTLITSFGLFFSDPLLKALGSTPSSHDYAKSYMTIILIGTTFNMFSNALNHTIRAAGNAFRSTITMLLGAILNIILDPIFIFTLGLGVQGAALATIISQFVSSIWVLSYFVSGKSPLKIRIKYMFPNIKVIMLIVSIGVAPFIMQASTSVVNIIVNNVLKIYGGTQAIGAMTIISSISFLFLMPVLGISQGIQPITGFNYGAKKYDRVRKILKYGIILSSVAVTLIFILIQLFPSQIISIFNKDPKLVAYGTSGLRIYNLMMPLLGFQLLTTHFFQNIKKAEFSLLLTLLRQVILLLPLCLILPRYYGINGVWIATPIADFGSSIITFIFLVREMRKLKNVPNVI
ncbi:MAG: mate efflux family protein [Clostridiales bacterium]|nr:mate efflux family protein [Clostridiales bacterium]